MNKTTDDIIRDFKKSMSELALDERRRVSNVEEIKRELSNSDLPKKPNRLLRICSL